MKRNLNPFEPNAIRVGASMPDEQPADGIKFGQGAQGYSFAQDPMFGLDSPKLPQSGTVRWK